MDRAGIIQIVKVKLDELTPAGVTNHPYDDIIDPILDESARELLLTAPLKLITPVALTTITYTSPYNQIELPATFLRIAYIKLSSWNRTVTRTITEEDPEYKLQENAYTRAGVNKPVVAIVQTATKKYLRCFPGKTSESGGTYLYVQEKLPEDLEDSLVDPLTWLAASKLLMVFEMPTQAQGALAQYQNAISIR